jgi:hypothetical protein
MCHKQRLRYGFSSIYWNHSFLALFLLLMKIETYEGPQESGDYSLQALHVFMHQVDYFVLPLLERLHTTTQRPQRNVVVSRFILGSNVFIVSTYTTF